MKPELILPGGDLERVKIALEYGADAVYVGINKHSLRKAEIRFDITEVGEAIAYAHSLGKRLFVTFNIFAHNDQLADIEKDMKAIAKFGPDAFIMADLGVINIAKRVAPDVAIHVSTQANTVNIEDVRFWRDFGAKRVVLARELSLKEIKEIHDAVPDIELEAFVHGSMCISYSGRCLMSNYMTGRDANRGECAQPCRWNYRVYSDTPPLSSLVTNPGISSDPSEGEPLFRSSSLSNEAQASESNDKDDSQSGIAASQAPRNDERFFLEEKNRPGEYFPIEETETGTNIMSSRDLAAIEILPEILDAGVMGLKVEGRNKSEYYLATVGYAYRHALDAIEHKTYTNEIKSELAEELQKLNNREYTTGFYLGDAKSGETYEGRAPIRKWDYIGRVIATPSTMLSSLVTNPGISNGPSEEDPRLRKDDRGKQIAASQAPRNDKDGFWHTVVVKNKITVGDKVEILSPTEITNDTITAIADLSGNELTEVNPGRDNQQAIVKLSNKYSKDSFIRKLYS